MSTRVTHEGLYDLNCCRGFVLQVADVTTLKVRHYVSLGLGPLVGKKGE